MSAAVFLLAEAHKSREEAARVREVAGLMSLAPDRERLSQQARQLERRAEELEQHAAALGGTIGKTQSLSRDINRLAAEIKDGLNALLGKKTE
jgi:ABC-type transporter Mla subunit MlaD